MGDLKSLSFSYQLFHKSVDLGAVGGVQEGTKREAHATGPRHGGRSQHRESCRN